jgi:hypothetical protein
LPLVQRLRQAMRVANVVSFREVVRPDGARLYNDF